MVSRTWILCICFLPLVVLLLVAHFASVAVIDGKGELCSQCHSMKGYCDSWSTSGHKGVRCSDCHVKGATLLRRQTNGLTLILSCGWAELTGRDISVEKVSTDTCISCHDSKYRMKPLSEESHRPHPHGDCSSCHQGVVHGNYDAELLSMRIKRSGRSLKVDHMFPDRISKSFHEKSHFQNGFAETMGFCGTCHQMAPSSNSVNTSIAEKGVTLCENCHIRY